MPADLETSPFPAPHGWMVIIALALNSSFNAFQCMNFSATQAASAAALNISEPEAAQFYSIYLACCMLFMTPVMWQTERYERGTLMSSVLATTVAAWIRWWALHSMSYQYELCLISQVLIGFGASGISTLPGQISHQRFRPNHWALTTSLMLMANYSGWLFGSFVPSVVVLEGSVQSLTNLFFAQAMYSVFTTTAFFLLYRSLPEDVARILAKDNAKKSNLGGFLAVFKVMASTPQFTFQLLAHGFFGAVGFVIPSAVLFILKDLGTPLVLDRITEIVFIGTGVLGGISLGAYSTDATTYPRTLKICYVLGSASLVLICGVAYSNVLSDFGVSVALVVLMAVAGFATLGFTGVLFEDLARFPNMTSSYVLWIGYEIILAISSVLNLVASNASGFWILAGTCLLTSLAFLTFYRQADDRLTNPTFSKAKSSQVSKPRGVRGTVALL